MTNAVGNSVETLVLNNRKGSLNEILSSTMSSLITLTAKDACSTASLIKLLYF